MARNKKNDFWDDVDLAEQASGQAAGSHKGRKAADEWSATKSTPIKVIMRILLMLSCMAALVSAYIAYEYVNDRYAGGSYSNNFYSSESFAKEYNKSVNSLMEMITAMEADPSVTEVGNEELLNAMVENYMGKDTNFAFLIQDGEHFQIVASGDDAKDRIETSNHYALLSNTDGQAETKSTIPGRLLNKEAWEEQLSASDKDYVIYTAVDNELTYKDSFYQANQQFEKMAEYFSYARIIGIVAAVIFIICLIFCILATGMKRGSNEVQLSWFDRIFTEIAVIIMAAVAGGLVYGQYRLLHMDGEYYRYAALALVVVIYIWVIRCYFSIVRRIKAGQLLRHSVIGTIIGGVAHAIGRLPSPLNVIVGALVLILINGAVVYGVVNMREYTFRGVPIMYIVAPVVFVIELLALLVHNSSSGDEELKEEAAERAVTGGESIQEASAAAAAAELEAAEEVGAAAEETAAAEAQDWEEMDLGRAIEDAQKQQAEAEESQSEQEYTLTQALKQEQEKSSRTVVLSADEMEEALKASGLTPDKADLEAAQKEAEAQGKATADDDAEGMVNFVELNKSVRKSFKPAFRKRGIAVTVRAPEKPVIIDIDSASLEKLICNIFEQMERLSADETRNYVEIYRQADKVVYIVRINVSEENMEAAQASLADSSFDDARKIVEANDGRFVLNMEGNVLKAGALIEAAE